MRNRLFSRMQRRYRRSISVVLLLCLLFSFNGAVFAGMFLPASVQVSDAAGAPGDTVSVAVYMDPGNEFPLQYSLSVGYDPNVLEPAPADAVTKELSSIQFTSDTTTIGTIKVDAGFFGDTMSFIDQRQKLFTIRFVVKPSAAAGDSAVTISSASFNDALFIPHTITSVTAGKVTVAPPGTVAIAIGSVSGLAGQTVDVPVVLTQFSKNIGSYGMQLDYDKNVLSAVYVAGASGDYFLSAFDNTAGYVKTAWTDAAGGDHYPAAGQTLFTVTFLIKDGAALGDQPITINSQSSLQHLTMTDSSAVEMQKTVVPGKVTVSVIPVPSAPTGLIAVAGNMKASLSWNAVTGADGYKLYMSTSAGSYDAPLATVSAATYSYEATGLANRTTYYFTVKAFNAGGESAPSNETNAIPRAPSTSTGSSSNSGSTGTSGTADKPAANSGVEVLVNGKVENAGTAAQSTVNGQTVTTVTIDPQKLQERLAAEGPGAVITIPVRTQSDVIVGELNGRMVKNMEQQQAVVEMKTGNATYTLPARQIDIDALSAQLGASVALQDIKIRITIAKPQADMAKIVDNSAVQGGFSIVAPPVEFTISGVYGDRTIAVSRFKAYVERTIALPSGVDPNKMTTAIVVEPDGAVRHVPTKVIQADGVYYAKVNSLTNSTYSVVWHPVTFADVENHWAKAAVNDMGSRMVVNGLDDTRFDPNQDITRAQFAAIVVRGLGLKLENGKTPFADVPASDWYSDVVHTAFSYNLISGFEDGTFRPLDVITREQALTIVSKAMAVSGLKAKLTAARTDVSLSSFADANQASVWASAGIEDCLRAGILSGREGNKLAPQAHITRAEVAAIIQRLLQNAGLI